MQWVYSIESPKDLKGLWNTFNDYPVTRRE
ncbi:hypothetical protein [Staphylococcus phage vB_SauM-V1SA19]|nr:hypothetical protein [Staphylococcus phage vB_SauM-V1SA19]